jgi:hypothetical protein
VDVTSILGSNDVSDSVSQASSGRLDDLEEWSKGLKSGAADEAELESFKREQLKRARCVVSESVGQRERGPASDTIRQCG